MAERRKGGGGGGGGSNANKIARLENEIDELKGRIERLREPLPVTADTAVQPFEPDASSGGMTGKLTIGEGDGQKARAFDGTRADLATLFDKAADAAEAMEEPAPEPAL